MMNKKTNIISELKNFCKVIIAKLPCESSDIISEDHFVDINKMVNIRSGTHREIDDIMLTRFACYLIAQNGDPKKEQIDYHFVDLTKTINTNNIYKSPTTMDN